VRVRALILALSLVGSTLLASPAEAQTITEGACNYDRRYDATFSDDGIGLTSALTGRPGRYALPSPAAKSPTALVALFHGYGNDSCSWRRHLRRVADTGAVAFAMDYESYAGAPATKGRRGWTVQQGAVDSIGQAQHFLATYPTIKLVIALGISMGGNASGLAVAQGARRADGAPLFDYWVGIEGVTNLSEEYAIVRGLAPVNVGAAEAKDDIERETGGPIEAKSDAFRQRTVVARAPDIAAGGLKGALLVHGLDDGLVPYNHVREMAGAFRAVGVPVEVYNVARSRTQEDFPNDTTLSGTVLGSLNPGYNSALAGHGWEGSNTQNVILTGFDQLFALLCGTRTSVAAYLEHLVDGDTPSPPACKAEVLGTSSGGSVAGGAGGAAGSAGSTRPANSLPATGRGGVVPLLAALALTLAVVSRRSLARR
jgi:pimeloyl-ACP methyl ester carboxylesterase